MGVQRVTDESSKKRRGFNSGNHQVKGKRKDKGLIAIKREMRAHLYICPFLTAITSAQYQNLPLDR